jgi:hypothetical protein
LHLIHCTALGNRSFPFFLFALFDVMLRSGRTIAESVNDEMYGDVEDVGSMGKVIDLLFNAS